MLGSSQDINTFTGLVVGVTAGSETLSSMYLGRLADRVWHRKILIASLAAGGLLYMPLVIAQAGWQILVLQALVGMAGGGIVPSISALYVRFTRQAWKAPFTGWITRLVPGHARWPR